MTGPEITGRARDARTHVSREIWIVLASQFVMNAASFMVVPFLVIYLSGTRHLSSFEVGTTLSVYLVALRLLPLMTGVLIDQIGHRFGLSAGVLIRGAGFLSFAVAVSWPWVLVPACLIGIGGAIYDPSVRAVIAAQPANARARIYALRNQFLNAGALIGPLLGAAMATRSPQLPFLVSGGTFVAGSIVLGAMPMRGEPMDRSLSWLAQLKEGLSHRGMQLLWPIMAVWWLLFTQLTVSFPVVAERLGGGAYYVSAVFVVNGAVGIAAIFFLQRPLREAPTALLAAVGFALLAAGFLMVPISSSVWWLMVCVGVYTIGETILMPCFDLIVAGFTTSKVRATMFGVSATSWAAGGALGSYLGTWLILQVGGGLPWLTYAGLAVICVAAMIGTGRAFRLAAS